MALNPRKVLEVLERAAIDSDGLCSVCENWIDSEADHDPDCKMLALMIACRAELDPEFAATLPRVGEE